MIFLIYTSITQINYSNTNKVQHYIYVHMYVPTLEEVIVGTLLVAIDEEDGVGTVVVVAAAAAVVVLVDNDGACVADTFDASTFIQSGEIMKDVSI